MIVKLLTEHHLEFLSLKGGSSEYTLVKMPHCWKSHVLAHNNLITVCFAGLFDLRWKFLRNNMQEGFVQVRASINYRTKWPPVGITEDQIAFQGFHLVGNIGQQNIFQLTSSSGDLGGCPS